MAHTKRLLYVDLKAVEEFVCLQQDGRRPQIPAFIRRHPETTCALREMLEGAQLVAREFKRFRREFPGVRFNDLHG